MSTKKPSVKERALAAINAQHATPAAAAAHGKAETPAHHDGPKTAPGMMMSFLSKQSDAIRENEDLKAQLAKWDGALPVHELDPNLIDDSKWANRHQDSFSGDEFKQLKEEIRSAGGNVQPVKVRPHPTQAGRYEVVFGHRRLRACRELGIPVKAMVAKASDQELFIDMDRENRSREDLRPFEQGLMYQRAIKEGLFASQNELAQAVGVSQGNVSTAIRLANLPAKVLGAFPSPLDIQYRWAKPLADMAEKHADRLADNLAKLSTADSVASLVADDDGELANKKLTPAEIFAILTDLTEPKAPPPRELVLGQSGAVVAEITRKGGRLNIAFDKGLKLDDKAVERVKKALEKLDLG